MIDEESQSLVRDLEELTSLSFHMLKDVTMKQMEDEKLRYAAGLFKAIWLAGEAAIRTHPLSDYYCARGGETWNPVIIAVLNRFLIEAYLDFHHLFLDKAEDGEADFRLVMARLHGVRNLLERDAGPGDDPRSVPPSSEELYRDAVRESLPHKEGYYKERLAANPYFKGPRLTDRDRSRLLCGKHNSSFRYGGIKCQPDRKKKAERADLRPQIADELHGHLSDFLHAGPVVADQLPFFSARVAFARSSMIDAPIALCCGMVACAIGGFAAVFPNCKHHLTDQAQSLVHRYASLVTAGGPTP